MRLDAKLVVCNGFGYNPQSSFLKWTINSIGSIPFKESFCTFLLWICVVGHHDDETLDLFWVRMLAMDGLLTDPLVARSGDAATAETLTNRRTYLPTQPLAACKFEFISLAGEFGRNPIPTIPLNHNHPILHRSARPTDLFQPLRQRLHISL